MDYLFGEHAAANVMSVYDLAVSPAANALRCAARFSVKSSQLLPAGEYSCHSIECHLQKPKRMEDAATTTVFFFRILVSV